MDEGTRELVRSLRDDPEARDELLRALLSDRFLELPARVDGIEEALQELVRAQLRTQEQLDALTQRVDDLAVAQTKTEIAVQTLADRFAKQLPKIDTAIGYIVERRYTERAAAYFAPIARRLKVLTQESLDDLVEQAIENGTLNPVEAQSIRLADTIASGRRDGETVHLVVESSYTVDERNVERAATRARLLGRLVGATVPVVAGEYLDESARTRAKEQRVWQVLDGVVMDPDGLRAT